VSLRTATPALVSQRVRTVLKDGPGPRIIAMRAEPKWNSGSLTVDHHRVEIDPCVSPLAVRSSLAGWADRDAQHRMDDESSDLLVVLCDLSEHELGEDVLARLAHRRVLPLEPWDAARSLFGVQRMDAAFGKDDGWIATALLEHVPADYAASVEAGTTLTREVALNSLAHQLLGARDVGVDAIIDAAARPEPFRRFDGLDGDTRAGLLGAVARASGPLGDLAAKILTAGRGADLVALGVAARAIYGDGGFEGGKAAGKLEEWCGGAVITPTVGAALAGRCEETVQRMAVANRDQVNAIVARAEALARGLMVPCPEASPLLPSGFHRRIALAVDALRSILTGVDEGATGAPAVLDGPLGELRRAVDDVKAHAESESPAGRRRRDRLAMAARLATWLASSATGTDGGPPASFVEAAARYAAEGAWVDRARRQLWRGDGDGDVATTYSELIDRVVGRRRMENERFAKLLASWTTSPSTPEELASSGLTTVEAVVDRVLARFTEQPLLFVVLDGCGLPSFCELAPQFGGAGFREIVHAGAGPAGNQAGRRLTAIAALPTVTQVSRASLIAGRLDRGNQDHERTQFESNPSLRPDGRPAVFFHQNRLAGAAGESLAAEVLAALGPEGRAVVGVVINTIDDQLRKGTFTEELRIDDVGALVPLLDAARNSGRAVIVSADHGHVLAQPGDGGSGVFSGGGDGGERWRVADRPAAEGEVLLRGDRVRLGGDAGILVPWEDDYRYGAKAGGYHGGATPEEVLVPVAVFLPAGTQEPTGWEAFGEARPLWWDLLAERAGVLEAAGRGKPGKARSRASKPVDEAQGAFELPTVLPTPATAGAPTVLRWVDALLSSVVWKEQKAKVGRAALPDDRVRAVLAAVVRRGSVISFAALAIDASMPQARLPGFLANLARVLNVDAYVVLDVDAAAQEARLSLPILGEQFQIDLGTL
jgi:PglZ domain